MSEEWCWVTNMIGFDVILGQPWLELHDPLTSWKSRQFVFSSDHCHYNCLTTGLPVQLTCKANGTGVAKTLVPEQRDGVEIISASYALSLIKRDPDSATWLLPEHFELLKESPELEAKANVLFDNLFTADIEDCSAVSMEDIAKFQDRLNRPPPSMEELRAQVPKAFHHILDLWDPKVAAGLPASRPGIDHEIKLVDGATPSFKRPYGLSREETIAVKNYLDVEVASGRVRRSKSPYASPLLIVKKPGGGLRICVDYRQLNAITVRNRNIPPKIRDTLSRLNRVSLFSKFDVISAFHQIRIKDGDQEKTAFLTRFGLFEYTVMPFGLTNAPATFQAYINEVLRDYLDEFCSAYLDDVLVFSERAEDHEAHCLKVLEKLHEAGLYLDIKKCEFNVTRTKYLGIILTTEGLEMDPDKVKAILEWKDLLTVKDVQAFIGFANFYRRFIFRFSAIVAPLINCIKLANNGKRIDFNSAAKAAFEALKKAFSEAPVLVHFDPDLDSYVETDASDWVVSGILSQMHDNVLRPVAFFSMKMGPAEINYPIYDKELLAIIKAFEEWKPELAGTATPVEVFTDHRSLEYFMTTKQLNRRQARWAEFLSEFHFIIKYRPGKQGTKPDSLTRRPGDIPKGVMDERIQRNSQVLLPPQQFEPGCNTREAIYLAHILNEDLEWTAEQMVHELYLFCEEGEELETSWDVLLAPADLEEESNNEQGALSEDSPSDQGGQPSAQELIDRIRSLTASDKILQRIIASLSQGDRRIPYELFHNKGIKVELGSCRYENGILYVKEKIFVPYDERLRADIVKMNHESLPAGHGGKHATYARVARHWFWPYSTDTVARYVRNCYTCARSKPCKEGRHGYLNPLPIPDRYWVDISVDFITPLPDSEYGGSIYKHLMVIVDRKSKKVKLVPLKSLDAEEVVHGFLQFAWREEGYPQTVISDRGSQFISSFWKRLCQRIGTSPKLSTAFHPETDGQTEIENARVKQYLRAYVNYDQSNWAELLPIAEFQLNSDKNQSTGLSPFEATKAYQPLMGTEPPREYSKDSAAKRHEKAADLLVDRIHKLQEFLHDNLVWAQAKMVDQANQRRKPAPAFKKGDWVMLDARNVRTVKKSRGLDQKNLGPFQIKRCVMDKAFELDLKDSLHGIFPVFHPWLLHPIDQNPLPGQRQEPQGPVSMDEEDDTPVYEVEEILESTTNRRRVDQLVAGRPKGLLMYKVKWKGWNNPSWQPYWDLTGCRAAVRLFHSRHPEADGPHKSFDNLTAQHETLASALVFVMTEQAEERVDAFAAMDQLVGNPEWKLVQGNHGFRSSGQQVRTLHQSTASVVAPVGRFGNPFDALKDLGEEKSSQEFVNDFLGGE